MTAETLTVTLSWVITSCGGTSKAMVRKLTRTAIGPVLLRGLRRGDLRELTLDELGVLLDAARL